MEARANNRGRIKRPESQGASVRELESGYEVYVMIVVSSAFQHEIETRQLHCQKADNSGHSALCRSPLGSSAAPIAIAGACGFRFIEEDENICGLQLACRAVGCAPPSAGSED